MNKILFILAAFAAAATAVSCNKMESVCGQTSSEGESLLYINLGEATKAASISSESERNIQNVQIFVFKGGTAADAGKLEVAVSKGFPTPLNVSTGSYVYPEPIKCSTGGKEVYVVVNDVADRTAASYNIRTKQQLLDQKTELKDNAVGKLLMVGSAAKTLSEGPESITVPVRRMCAAVVLESVTNAFSSAVYQTDNSFRVKDVYLLNVPGVQNFNLNAQLDPSIQDDATWYSKMTPETGSLKSDLIYDTVTPKVVNYSDKDQTVHTFYSYPNSCAFQEAASWSKRATLLVLSAEIWDGTGWYPSFYTVALKDGIMSNYKYKVNITVNRPGSDDPNHPVKFCDVTPTITVQDWDTGESYSPSI